MSDDRPPMSAARSAEVLGELPGPESVPAEASALAARVRELVEAVVRTDVPAATMADVAAQVAALTATLQSTARSGDAPIRLIRHPDGRLENLTQAGSGRLNPQAPPLEFLDLPPEPALGAPPSPVEVRARVTLGAAHGGSPARAHGGVVALLLDQVLGLAAHAAGASGLTKTLVVDFRRATPLGVALDLTARCTEWGEGRSRATGELRAGDTVAATAEATFVTDRR